VTLSDHLGPGDSAEWVKIRALQRAYPRSVSPKSPT